MLSEFVLLATMPGSKFVLIVALLRQSSSQHTLLCMMANQARLNHPRAIEPTSLRIQAVSEQVELLSSATLVLSGDWQAWPDI